MLQQTVAGIDEPLLRAAVAICAAAGGFALGFWALHRWGRASLRTDAGRRRLPGRLTTAWAAAAACGVAGWGAGLTALLPAAVAFAVVGTTVSVVDLAEQRIPNRILIVGAASVGPLLVGALLMTVDWRSLLGAGLGAAAMFAAYFLMALISPRAMGMGDVKLAALAGALLGAHGLTAWVSGLLITFVIGGVAAVIQLARRRLKPRDGIPFGPFIVAGTLLALTI